MNLATRFLVQTFLHSSWEVIRENKETVALATLLVQTLSHSSLEVTQVLGMFHIGNCNSPLSSDNIDLCGISVPGFVSNKPQENKKLTSGMYTTTGKKEVRQKMGPIIVSTA